MVAALPEPDGLLRVELTFLRAVVTSDAERACPSVVAFPSYDALRARTRAQHVGEKAKLSL